MKCKIPQRQKILNQKARHVIRQQIGYCSALVLAETWGWGDKRLNDLKRDVDAMYSLYDDKYKDSYEYTQMLVGLFTDGSYPVRPGSGEKVLIGREHDIAYLCHAYQLRKRGFGIGRIQTYYKELQKRIKYYNKTFSDAPGEVLGVMENRLATRGITL